MTDPYEPAVMHILNQFRAAAATWERVARPARYGDLVCVNACVTLPTADPIELLKTEDAEFLLHKDGQRPTVDFFKHIVGRTKGAQIRCTDKLPLTHRNVSIAGRTVHVTIDIVWIKEKTLPALDDALPRKVGTTHLTLAQLIDGIRDNIAIRKAYDALKGPPT